MPAALARDARATERVTVVMTPAQRRMLEQRARRAGMTISTYIRQQALGSEDVGPLLEHLRASTERANQALDRAYAALAAHAGALRRAEANGRAAGARSKAA